MKKLKKFCLTFLILLLMSCFLTEIIPESDMLLEVQAATKPSTPKLVSAELSGTNIVVKWKKVKNAEGYRVYRKTAGGKWSKIKTITKNSTVSYTDKKCKNGTVYYYTVRAYIKSGGETILSNYDSKGLPCVVLTTPKLYSAEITGAKRILVRWECMSGVKGYRIYRKTNNGKWILQKKISGASSTSYEDTNVLPGNTYIYTVRSYVKASDKTLLSGYNSAGKKVSMKIPAPDFNVNAVGNTVKINLAIPDGSDGFRIYRKEEGAASWDRLVTSSNEKATSYTDKKITLGKTYYYTVRAYINGSSGKIWGSYNKTGKKIDMGLPGITDLKIKGKYSGSESKVVLSWNPVAGADGYEISRKHTQVPESKLVPIETLEGNSLCTYTDTSVDLLEYYTYCVKAYKYRNGVPVYSSEVQENFYVEIPETELISAVGESSERIELTWKPIPGVSGYGIFIQKEEGGWKNIDYAFGASPNKYTVKNLEANKKYTFTVRAYIWNGYRNVWGKYNKNGISATTEASIALDKTSITMIKGATEKISLLGNYKNATWHSDGNEIAVASGTGNYVTVRAIKKGVVDIIAIYGSSSYTCRVTVEDPVFKTDKNVLEVGESTYVSFEGTTLDMEWSCDDYLSIEKIDDNTVKVTALKPGHAAVRTCIKENYYSTNIDVKGTIQVSDSDVTITKGETKEIFITSDYDTVYTFGYVDDITTSLYSEKVSDGKWKIVLTGITTGDGYIDVTNPGTNPTGTDAIVSVRINVHVVPNETAIRNNELLIKHIKEKGVLKNEWYTVSKTVNSAENSNIMYKSDISYHIAWNEFKYTYQINTGKEIMELSIMGNPTGSEVFNAAYNCRDNTTGASIKATGFINTRTFSAEYLSLVLNEASGFENDVINEKIAEASDLFSYAIDSWNEYLMKNLSCKLTDMGFIVSK